jgi:hypothetical protein
MHVPNLGMRSKEANYNIPCLIERHSIIEANMAVAPPNLGSPNNVAQTKPRVVRIAI